MNQLDHTAKCPKCGAGHLKRAHGVTVVALFRIPLGKRRYRCAECGWTGWKRRLLRRERGSRRPRTDLRVAKDTVTAFLVTMALLVVLWVAFRVYATW